jgi:peptidyl-tRNA hydrolase
MERLYIVVRSDLPAGAQLAQACHALGAFEAEHRDLYRAWHAGENNLVVLSVPTDLELSALIGRAKEAHVPHATFREPDFDGALTGVALGASAKKLVSQLPLALRARSESDACARAPAAPHG